VQRRDPVGERQIDVEALVRDTCVRHKAAGVAFVRVWMEWSIVAAL